MAGALGDLVVSLTAETVQFKDALTKAAAHLDTTMGGMTGSLNTFQNTLNSIDNHLSNFGINLRNLMGIAAAGGIMELASSAIEAAAHIQLLSEKTGIFADQLAGMRQAATAGGVSLDEVANASVKLSKNVETGAAPATKALDALGLSMEDLKAHSPAEQMQIVAQRMNNFADGSGKAAAAQLLFGKAGADVLAFLKQYGDQINLTTKGYNEYAAQAHEVEVGLQKLKFASQEIVNHYVAAFLPVVLAVLDGLDRFKNIIIAAIVVFAGLPLATMAATAAYGALSTAMAANAIAAEMGMGTVSLLNVSLWGTSVAAQAATGALGILNIAAGLLFAAYAGWQFGSWLSEQFLSVRLAGIGFIDSLLTGWEYLKYGATVAWETIKFLFTQTVGIMRNDFADFIANIGKGFAAIGAGDTAAAMASLADAIRPAVSATDGYATALQNAAAQKDKAVSAVHDITDSMMVDAIVNDGATKAKDRHTKAQVHLTTALKDAKNPAQDWIDKITEQTEKLGMSSTEAMTYDGILKGVSETLAYKLANAYTVAKAGADEHTKSIKDATEEYKIGEEEARAYAKAIDVWSNQSLSDWASGNDALVLVNWNLGQSKIAIDLDAAAAKNTADINKASLLDSAQDQANYTAAVTAEYNKRLDLIRSGADKQAMLDNIDAEVKAMQDAADAAQKAWDTTSKSIDKSLTDAF